MGLFKIVDEVGRKRGPHLLITAGVHGDEPEGVEALQRLSDALAGYDLVGRVTMVPIVNTSAYALGTRTGDDGLDLARVFPGRPDGSRTERVAHELAAWIRSVDYYIDLHSGGKTMRVLPLAGYMLVSDSTVLDRQRAMARAFGLPIVWGTTSRLEGRSLSVARDAGVPAIYAEYLGAASCSDEGVTAYIEGCLNVMHWAAMLPDWAPSKTAQVREYEDPREQSGHLQIQHPCPFIGMFKAKAALGDIVTRGQVIGQVVGRSGKRGRYIHAECAGRLICQRVDGPVDKGDGLGVILETDLVSQSR